MAFPDIALSADAYLAHSSVRTSPSFCAARSGRDRGLGAQLTGGRSASICVTIAFRHGQAAMLRWRDALRILPRTGRSSPMSDTRSFAVRLADDLEVIRVAFASVIQRSEIINTDLNRGSRDIVFIGFPTVGWASDEGLVGERTRLLVRVHEWADLFALLHRNALPVTQTRIDERLELVRNWLIRDGGDWSVPTTIQQALAKADETFAGLVELIELGTHGQRATLVVPDTNSLLRDPDVAAFRAQVGSDSYAVVMLTTVMSELDELNDRGRTQDVRDKAKAAVRRLKGLRDRGDVRVGVPVQGRTTLRMEHREVSPASVLDWLDPSVPDDRILGGALDLQARFPAATVLLITADLNLQNKAAAVGLPFADPEP